MNPVGHQQQQPAFEFDTGRGESGYGILDPPGQLSVSGAKLPCPAGHIVAGRCGACCEPKRS